MGVTGRTLSSDLGVRHHPRSSSQQAQAGIRAKYDRGDTPAERLEQEKMVVKALPHKLACKNAIRLIMAEDVAKHDIAKECQQWQVGLRAFREELVKNDMLTPFLVPTEFDVNDPSKTRGPFRDLTEDFHLVTLDEAKLWQSYLLVHARDEELESCT